MAFLTFIEVSNPGKKTKRWVIYNRDNNVLGHIVFHAPWRKYVWSMSSTVIFDIGCTQEVVDFLTAHAGDRNA